MKPLILSVFFTFLLIFPGLSNADDGDQTLSIDSWLMAGPVEVLMPLYADVENITGDTFEVSNLMSHNPVSPSDFQPSNGSQFIQHRGRTLTWRNTGIADILSSLEKPENEESVFIYYMAVQVRAHRWLETSFHAESHNALAVYLNGEQKASKFTIGDDAGSVSSNMKLTPGVHTLVLKYVTTSESSEMTLDAHFKTSESYANALQTHTETARPVKLEDLTDAPAPASIRLSADGNLAAVTIRRAIPDQNTWESYIEVRNTSDGSLVTTYRGGMNITGLNWAPSGRVFTYTNTSGGSTTLWLVDLDRGTQEKLLENVSSMGGHEWSPNGEFILFSKSESYTPDGTGVSRLDGMHDRYPWWRTRSFLYKLDVNSKAVERLTAGILTTSLGSISPDGSQIVFSRSHVDYSQRPFTTTEMVVMNLNTFETEVLFNTPWVSGGSFSPDGTKLLLTGSPNAFDGVGRNVDGDLANDYDGQAYIYDLQSGDIDPISFDFNPAVDGAMWSYDGRSIYLATTDRSFNNVYRFDLRSRSFTMLQTGVDMTAGFTIASNANMAAFVGHGINDYHKAYTYDLRRDRVRLLVDPAEQYYKNVYFGTSKDWNFIAEDGTEIEGHVYYPVDFDPDNSYPVIVYYYGGTVPVTRGFSGRYPKELYAAHGYIVYVLQPSGATGFGQEFSTRHLNEWGSLVTGEIIDGVTQFLEAHPYADSERVGAMGASFGGFMTMLLITETDIFSAAVSHAGISNITSYWGEGFWGYLYSSVASANSFPWDAPEVFIDQSPIFRADRVTTPLMLVTGMDDTNVPAGESIQFYTALKLLGRDVEFIQVEGQDHHIVDYDKFKLWKNAIISWFDAKLKGEEEWWNDSFN